MQSKIGYDVKALTPSFLAHRTDSFRIEHTEHANSFRIDAIKVVTYSTVRQAPNHQE